MDEPPPPRNLPVLRRNIPPAVAEILEGLGIQNAIPKEMMPAIAEVLGYLHQMDDVAEKRKQIQRR